jgi:hypothetical protein
VSVVAAMPGYGNLGNAIEADFSRLVLTTATQGSNSPVVPPGPGPIDPSEPGPNPIPLPPVLIPAGLMLAGLAASKRRMRRWLQG